jgi:hypothetical protein
MAALPMKRFLLLPVLLLGGHNELACASNSVQCVQGQTDAEAQDCRFSEVCGGQRFTGYCDMDGGFCYCVTAGLFPSGEDAGIDYRCYYLLGDYAPGTAPDGGASMDAGPGSLRAKLAGAGFPFDLTYPPELCGVSPSPPLPASAPCSFSAMMASCAFPQGEITSAPSDSSGCGYGGD